MQKKCETFGCAKPGAQMYQIAPGTNIWLCQHCGRELRKDGNN
jgi:ribosomal protein L37AE/L43A